MKSLKLSLVPLLILLLIDVRGHVAWMPTTVGSEQAVSCAIANTAFQAGEKMN